MKTLDNKTLIYDSNCPLCCWYTDKFVQIGALEEYGRISFNELGADYTNKLDLHRSRHEMPVYFEILVFTLMQIRMIIAFSKRLENKNYLL